MCRKLSVIVLALSYWLPAVGQEPYLNRSDLMDRVDSCLRHTYNFSFQRARHFQAELLKATPEHPAPHFLEALIIYWENFPLTPENKESEQFVNLMTKAVTLSEAYIEGENTHLEGVFFDLFGRALKAMYWADNGKAGKVIPDLRTMYRHTMEGFELQDQFSEFYFSTGLYNYYIEAYPQAHPVYKPLLAFMKDGDKKLGLQQLDHAIDHSIYLKVESMLFMSLIQLKYEKDLHAAVIYAERLYKGYPHNIFFQGHLVTILLHLHRYQQVREVLDAMKTQSDSYSAMVRSMAAAFMAEKEAGNLPLAEQEYLKTIELADSFGPIADVFTAMGYMGLSRIYEKNGLHNESGKYARKASKYTVYRFILDQ